MTDVSLEKRHEGDTGAEQQELQVLVLGVGELIRDELGHRHVQEHAGGDGQEDTHGLSTDVFVQSHADEDAEWVEEDEEDEHTNSLLLGGLVLDETGGHAEGLGEAVGNHSQEEGQSSLLVRGQTEDHTLENTMATKSELQTLPTSLPNT